MSASPPAPAEAPTDRCGRCGSVLPATGGTVTCQECLLTDLRAETVADWFAPSGETGLTGLKAAGGFTLLEEIGHGGMGRVFRARQQSPDREVAVKVLMPHLSGSAETRRRFLAESAVMAGLDHPGLLPLYACGETDGRPWLATRLAAGGNLAQRRKSYEGRWQAIAELTAQLAEAIQHAHARGIIHRDLKPSNILFDGHGAASVADFGLAKWRDENTAGQTLSHAVMGTPAYMAPELAIHGSRGATTAADVYGLGAILYELLTGQAPHVGSTPVEILHRVTTCDPPAPRLLRPEVPKDLAVICLRALARLPGDRYESAAALAADLHRYRNGYPVTARPYSLAERGLRWVRRHPLAAGLMAALTAVLIGSAWLLVRKNAELIAADARRQLAADDAEARVAYAIEVLPDKLAPLGRLSDLQDLFADVADHYVNVRAQNAPSSNPLLTRLREAFFNLQWGRVLRPQGRTADAELCFKQAEQMASSLTLQPDAPARAWALLAQSRQWLGLMALRQGNEEEGSRLLEEAIADTGRGLERFPAHPELLVARAGARAERCDTLLAGEGGEPAALDALEAAWREAIAGNAEASPAEHQHHARELAKVLYYRGDAAQKRGDWAAAETHFRALLQERERLAALPAATNEDSCAIANACNRVVRAMLGEEANPGDETRRLEMKALVARQQDIMSVLRKSDPTNLHWRSEAALMSIQEAGPYIKKNDFDKAIPPLQRAAELIRGVPDEVNRNLETGRSTILNALTRASWLQTTKLSQEATAAAAKGDAAGLRARACAAADAAFLAARETFPYGSHNIPQNALAVSCGTWEKHAPAGYARRRLEADLAAPSAAPGWKNLLASQLVKMDAAAVPAPPQPDQPSPP